MIDRLDDLLKSAGKLLGIPLHLDRNHACAIQIRKGVIVQLQTDTAQERLLIVSQLADISPGKFREDVLKEALKANGAEDPCVGIFAYLSSINQLVLFQRYPLDLLTGERLVALLGPFIETAESWHNSSIAGLTNPPGKSTGHPPFGLRP